MAIRNDKDDNETEVSAVVSSTSEPTKSTEEEVDWTQIRSMVEVETPKVPIAVHFPIIDWVWETDEKMRKYLKIVRAGDTVEKFMSFYRCIKALSRDDLDDMWSIAVRKYQNAQRHSDEHIVYNSLSILYEMDPENDFYKDTSRVKAWYCYSHNGVHLVQLHSGVFAYFFIGTEYPWNIGHLSSMLSLTMKSDDLDTAASLVHEIQQYYKKAQEKHVAQSEERRKKRIAELKKQFEQILK